MEHARETTEPTSIGTAYRPTAGPAAGDREANPGETSRREHVGGPEPPFTPGETE